MTDEELLTVDEVARRLKLHPETVRRWIRAGKLRAIRLAAIAPVCGSERQRFSASWELVTRR